MEILRVPRDSDQIPPEGSDGVPPVDPVEKKPKTGDPESPIAERKEKDGERPKNETEHSREAKKDNGLGGTLDVIA